MNDTMKLALQLTAVDMMSGVLDSMKRHVLNLGKAGEQVARDYDRMSRHITVGLKSISVGMYAIRKMEKGIRPAADLQEAMIDVKMSLMRSGLEAKTLNAELDQVRKTAIELQSISPFAAQDVVEVQKELLQSGLEFQNVVGNGAAKAAVTLATITKDSTELASSVMLGVGVPYHLEAKDYGQLADVIQRHAMSGRMKLPQLNDSLPYVAKVAKSFGVSWEDMLTGLAVMGEQGTLGSMAGTDLKDFYARLTGSSRISRKVMGSLNAKLKTEGQGTLNFWEKNGEMKSTHDIIENLRGTLGKMDTHRKMFYLEKIFGEQGGQAALALMHEGVGSWEFVKEKVEETASASAKIEERLKGMNAQVKALEGNSKTLGSILFQPMLKALTPTTKLVSDITFGLGKIFDNHPKLTTGANVLMGGAALGGLGYGAYRLIRGARAGRSVLKGIGGFRGLFGNLGGTAVGVAEGKALQAATGVQPVFVTNMPSGLGGLTGGPPPIPGIGGPGKVVSALKAGGQVLGAGTAGYAAGTVANELMGWISGKMTGGKYGGSGWLGSMIYDWVHPKEETKNDIKLDIAIDGNNRALVKSNDPNTKSTVNMKRGSFLTDDPLMAF